MRQLHYYPGNASMAPHVVLREIGAPFELVLVDRTRDAHKSESYLRLNPNGQIPVLVDGDLVLYEAAAICLYLADTSPQHDLLPAIGTAERAQAYKWLMWMTNTVQPALMVYFYPERWLKPGHEAMAEELRAVAEDRVAGLLGQIDLELARHGQPWLLGEDFSVLDPFCFMLCRWTRGFSSQPARAFPHVGPYLQRLLHRPSIQEVLSVEGLAAPWV